jgi:hypothetical protein
MYNANATRINKNSQIFKILNTIAVKNGATKYECLTEGLGLEGSKQRLRGYYSVCFRGLSDNGVLSYSKENYKYHLTQLGIQRYLDAASK